MVKRVSIHILIQLGIAILAGTVAAFSAALLTGAIGGVAMGIAPISTFGLVEGFVCPEGTALIYSEVKRSYHDPGESEPQILCVDPDGKGLDVLLDAILTVLGMVFIGVWLASFVPLFIPFAVIGFILTRKSLRSRE